MPDDERTRRRLGDATRNRIADLASGWSVGDEPEPDPEPEPKPAPKSTPAPKIELTPDSNPPTPPRERRKTQPPPPPGSPARKQLEDAIVDAVHTPVPGTLKAPALPPLAPPARPKTPSKPPALPPSTPKVNAFGAKAGPTETGTVELAGAIGGKLDDDPLRDPPSHIAALAAARANTTDVSAAPSGMPPPVPPSRTRLDDLMPSTATPPKGLDTKPVPRGEFEIGGGGGTEVEQEKLRIAYEQSTLKRDAANALLGVAEAPETVVKPPPVEMLLHETAEVLRGDPTSIDAPLTTKFERGDPTSLGGDPTLASTSIPEGMGAGTLRAQAALKRKRGLGGDVRYVLTVLFGVRKARQELIALEAKQELRQQSRKRHLVTLGRSAATLDGFDHPALGPTRERLLAVEDERSQHSAAVSAADGELTRVRSGRVAKAKEHAEEIKALDIELVEINKKVEPLEKDVSTIARGASELKESLRKLDIKIANTEMRMQNVQGKDLATTQAEIATFKADRIAVKRDEPKLAGELDALNPRIAALEARRGEAKRRRSDIEKAEIEDQKRCDDLLAAIGAKRKVVDRAAVDAETLRDKVLFDLGERLYVDRPLDLGPQLAPIDVIDMELGTGDRRSMELKEILQSVDKAKLARGVGVLTLVVAVAATITLFALGVF